MSNYYDVLGVGKTATEKEIRQAYRRLARQYHPDVNKSDSAAEDKFKEINEAHSVLSDEDSRKKYDRFGDNWRQADQYSQPQGAPGGGVRWTVMDGDDAYSPFGGPGGAFDGFFGARPTRSRVWRPPPAEFHTSVSLEEAFQGGSRNLRTQDGRTLEVSIPAGVDNGSRVHVSPDGPQGADYYLVVSVRDHPSVHAGGARSLCRYRLAGRRRRAGR